MVEFQHFRRIGTEDKRMVDTVGENHAKMVDECRTLMFRALDKWEQTRKQADYHKFAEWQERFRKHEAELKCG